MHYRSYLPVLGALGTFLALADPTPAADPPPALYGTIKGRLVWGGSAAPTLPPLVKQADPKVKDAATCAAGDLVDRSLVVNPENKGVAYAFVYLPKPEGKNAEAEAALAEADPTATIDQKNCEFLPYALAIHEDQKLIFKSSDPVLHNVRYSAFVNPAMNLALPPNGASPPATLKAERRPIKLACDVHPWMSGWVMIFDHPFFAVTDADGNFEIKGVPVGTQNLIVWQEKAGYVTEGKAKGMPVTVEAGEVTVIPDIVLDPSMVKDAKPAGN